MPKKKKHKLPGIPVKDTGWGILSPANFAGTDQGVDFTGSGPVPALGDGIVTDVGSSSIIEGGSYPYVIYKLTSGPYKGHYLYLAENFTPEVKRGTKLKQGQSLGQAAGQYPYVEYGFNRTPSGWNPVAPLGTDPHASTSIGSQMAQFISDVTGHQIGSGSGGDNSGGGSGLLSGVSSALAGGGCIVPATLILGAMGSITWFVIIPFL